jgi:hypothetical protein
VGKDITTSPELEAVARELREAGVGVHWAGSMGEPKVPRRKNPDGTYEDGMGRNRGVTRDNPLTQMEMRLHMSELAGLLLQGVTIVKACQMIGIPYYTARKHYINHPDFQNLLKQAGDEAFDKIKGEIISRTQSIQERAASLAEESLDKMEELLHESRNEHIQFKVAQDLLDRDPRLSRTKRIEGTGPMLSLPGNVLILAASAAREIESKGNNFMTIPAVPEPEPEPKPAPAPKPETPPSET